MPKISALPPAGTLADDDETPFVDDSAATTKKFTLAGLLVWLQSKTSWITTAMLGDGQVSSEKLLASIACKAYRSTAFSFSTLAKITLNAELFDVGSDFDTTNGRFVAPVNGYYQFTGSVGVQNIGDGNALSMYVYVNGSAYAGSVVNGASAGSDPTINVTDIAYLTAGQYIELYAQSNVSATGSAIATDTFLSVNFIGV